MIYVVDRKTGIRCGDLRLLMYNIDLNPKE